MTGYQLVNLRFDTAAMDLLLNHPNGPVGRHIGVIGLRITVMAKRLCGFRTGRLQKSIRSRQVRMAGGQRVIVYSNVKYAFDVHEGTKPHIIDPKGNRVMSFMDGGRRVVTQRVNHPGSRGKHYLTIPLRRVVH